MANKTFGALVQQVLSNIQQDSSDATSIHAHRARRAAMDVMRRLRKEEFHFTQADGQFLSTAGGYEYDLDSKLSSNVRRPINVWYTDGATEAGASASLLPGSGWIPGDNRGVPQLDWNDVIERVRSSTTNQNYIDSWAWYQRKLWIAPRLDGVLYIVVRFVETPKIFDYSYSSGAWTYHTISSGSTSAHDGVVIDDQEDPDGWLEEAWGVLAAEATRDLYLGPYQAKDPKKVLSESWIAKRNEEWDSLVRQEQLGQGTRRVLPYMMPQ